MRPKPLTGAAHINRSLPVAHGLVFATMLHEGAGAPGALVGALPPTALGSTPTWTTTQGLRGVTGPGRWAYTARDVPGLTTFTVATQVVPADTSTRVDVFGRWDTERHFLILLNLTAGKVTAATHDGSGFIILDSTVSITAGEAVSIAATFTAGDAVRLYVNGRAAGLLSLGTPDQTGGTSPVTICGSADTPSGVAPVLYGLIHRGILPVSLIQDLHTQPLAVLSRPRRRAYAVGGLSGGAAYSLTLDPATVTITGTAVGTLATRRLDTASAGVTIAGTAVTTTYSGASPFPDIAAALSTGATVANSTDLVLTHPTGHASGDRILYIIGVDQAPSVGATTGWSQTVVPNGSLVTLLVLWRNFDGSEGSAVTFAGLFGSTQMHSSVGHRFVAGTFDPAEAPDIATATGTSAAANPPTNTAAWGSGNNHFLSGAIFNGNATIVDAAPTNYAALGSAGAGGNAQATVTITAERNLAGATDDPDTVEVNASQAWVSFTIITRPSSGGAFSLSLDPATVTLAGTAVGTLATRLLSVEPASLALTGTVAGTFAGWRLAADVAATALSAQNVTLVYVPAGGYLLLIEPATVSLGAQDVGVARGFVLVPNPAAVTIAGTAVTPRHGHRLLVEPGVYLLSATAVGLNSSEEVALAVIEITLPSAGRPGRLRAQVPTIVLTGGPGEIVL